jgi:hypothetical protein
MTPLVTNKVEAVSVVVGALDAGMLSGQVGTARYLTPCGRRCGIGQLYSLEDAGRLEHGTTYSLARGLIERGDLVVDDPEWFIELQEQHDAADLMTKKGIAQFRAWLTK